MGERIKDRLIKIVTSRLTVMIIFVLILTGILIYRLFNLQIVRGEEFLTNFMLESRKTREVSSVRGNIYDREGNLLAYNELAYSVKIEDVYETGSSKNRLLNANIYKLIGMIEKNGDSIITDFGIVLDENGNFAYSASDDTSRLRFIADVYGERYVADLKLEQQTATADEIIEYLGQRYAIGEREDTDNSRSDFIVGKGYTKDELLKMITVRYAMSLTSYQKYIGTTVAQDISEKTRAVIMENLSELDGVSIVEDTVRRYVDSVYFSQIIGYTGKISSSEMETYNARDLEEGGDGDRYSINDVVGKTGIEAYMETTLQGTKGIEVVYVNNTGKVISIDEENSWDPVAGNDVYLTIDKDLQIATYNILEQKIAGVLLSKIKNAKEYTGTSTSNQELYIPIYDVYFALFNNSVINVNHMASEDAGETEAAVYAEYLAYKDEVYATLTEEIYETQTPYNKLKAEYQVYESNIIEYLGTRGIIDTSLVDTTDATYIAWRTDETISMTEYLRYAISMGWIDVTKLDLDSRYADAEEIFDKVVESIFTILDNTTDYQRKLYKYMLLNDRITGRQVAYIICEQGLVEVSEEDINQLYAGRLSAYDFMLNRITNLDITPADLALDPCNGSVVITDVNSGDVLALVSYPGYDNNKMANSVDAEYYAALRADKSNPLLNYATQYKSAPGSTFKMVSATAALMEGIVTTRTTITCTGLFDVVSPAPRCWIYPRGTHGPMNVSNAITNSCNFFFYQVGYNMSTLSGSYNAEEGLATLAKYADLYGLTERSGVEIAEYTPDVSTDYPIQSAIGQGSNSFTTVGLARYVATVANSGTCYNLTLLDKVANPDGRVIQEYDPEVRNTIEMPEEYWTAIHTGMRGVVENMSYYSDLGMDVAGKTGTAQENNRANHAVFVGYAPYENPEIAIATRIAYGYSSSYAAQATREIIKYYYNLADEEEILTGEASEAEVATYGD